MPRILAIEADRERSRLLTTLVREHVQADLTFAESVQAAVSVIGQEPPDLILAPALLSPPDEATLLSHVKELESARHLQILTIPAFDMLVEPPVEEKRARDMFVPIFRPREPRPWLEYDPQMVATQIAECLAHARELRADREMERACAESFAAFAAGAGPSEQGLSVSSGVSANAAGSEAQSESVEAAERRYAHRSTRNDVPWLSSITLSWGLEVRLINISTTGVLIETGSKFAPGATTGLRLTGSGTDTIVTVRFVRSEVARIDALGVKYFAAGAFETEVDLAGPKRDVATPASPTQALAGLLATVIDESAYQPEPAHVRFARGLRKLARVRDVQLRNEPTAAVDGRDSIYFDVPGDTRRRVLQVIFDRNHDLRAEEFRILKAAAWLTAAVLELETRVDQSKDRSLHGGPRMALLPEAIPEVA